MTVFLREVVNSFYTDIGVAYRSQRIPGQICFAPVLYCYENRRIWRPCETDVTHTQASRFQSVAQPADAYERDRPLINPDLSTKEEFPVLKAKQRPVALIKLPVRNEGVPDFSSAAKPMPIVLPIYGVQDASGRAKFDGGFLSRVQQLEYPEFFFLPAGGPLTEDSLIALSRVTHIYEAHLDPTRWALSDEVLPVLRGQLNYWLTGNYDGPYRVARDQLFVVP